MSEVPPPRTRDYLVADMLPYMLRDHVDENDREWNFTVDEARQLNVDGLPLLVEHNDGDPDAAGVQLPRIAVGRVEASSVRVPHAKMLASIEPGASSAQARAASHAVASGAFKDVSLQHRVSRRASARAGGAPVSVKRPTEVSLVGEGWRYGSRIRDFFPSRATLTRLAVESPDDLETFIDRFGYRPAVIDAGVAPASRGAYIDVLAKASDERLDKAVAEHRLYSGDVPSPRPWLTCGDGGTQVPATADDNEHAN